MRTDRMEKMELMLMIGSLVVSLCGIVMLITGEVTNGLLALILGELMRGKL